jgi:hypothetical protein
MAGLYLVLDRALRAAVKRICALYHKYCTGGSVLASGLSGKRCDASL